MDANREGTRDPPARVSGLSHDPRKPPASFPLYGLPGSYVWGCDMIADIPLIDQLVAHHYLFYSCGTPVIEWKDYLNAKKEFIASGEKSHLLGLLTKGEKKVVDYPPHIRGLAYYMLYKHMVKTGEWNENALPYSWTREP